jgi:hypothetical protein
VFARSRRGVHGDASPADGPAAKLRGNDDVREFYLGLSEAGRRKSFKDVKFYKRRKRWAF